MEIIRNFLLVVEDKEIPINNIKISTDSYGYQDYSLCVDNDIFEALRILKGDKIFNQNPGEYIKKKDLVSDCILYQYIDGEYIKIMDIYSLMISSYNIEEKEIAFTSDHIIYYNEGSVINITPNINNLKLYSFGRLYNFREDDFDDEDYYSDLDDEYYYEDDYIELEPEEKKDNLIENFKNSMNKIMNKIL